MGKTGAIVADTAVPLEGGEVFSVARWRSLEPAVLGIGTIVFLLLVWQAVPHVFTMSPGAKLFFTPPSRIAATLGQMFASGEIWLPLRVSAAAFALGLAMAIAVGLPLGVLLGRSRTLNAMLDPFISGFN